MKAIEGRVWKCVCIVGVGLIGGSLALGLRRGARVQTVLGVDVDKDGLLYAVRRGVVDAAAEWQDGVERADLIVLATPPDVTTRLLPMVSKQLGDRRPETIIMDVCGTKSVICAEAELQSLCFVGGHPLAGSEKSGVRAASATLLENAVFVLTPTSGIGERDVADVAALLRSAGTRPILMQPEEHDRVVAAISHVPHLVAAALVNQVAEHAGSSSTYAELAAGGFRDITRIASSDPGLWSALTRANARMILPLLEDWRSRIEWLEERINAGDQAALHDFFAAARAFRENLPTRLVGAIQAQYSLTVEVADEPGIIGKIAALVGSHGVSIRNIGILESREEELGQLILQFDAAPAQERALDVLRAHGYTCARRE